MSAPPNGLATAYRYCETVTAVEARNFAYGIRLLPAPKRRALSAVYAFARRLDDVGDGPAPVDRKLARLAAARADIAAMADAADSDDPVLLALSDATRRFGLPLDAFDELVEGIEMDVRGTTYTTIDELIRYCRCVAGTVGRLSLGVFGSSDPATAVPLADRLGLALQLTNILRDLREDCAQQRVYLPKEDLVEFGYDIAIGPDARLVGPPERLAALVAFECERARVWYAEGLALLPLLDRRSRACAGAMAGIYARLLDRIAAHPTSVAGERVSLTTREKAAVAARALIGMPA